MTVRARIIARLVAEPGRHLCSSCIAEPLAISQQAVRNAALSLPPTAFDRRITSCDGCGAQRVTISHSVGRAAAG